MVNTHEIIKLQDPIEVAGVKYTELTLLIPKHKHVKNVKHIKDDDERLMMLLCTLCNVSEEVLDECSMRDIAELVKKFEKVSNPSTT